MDEYEIQWALKNAQVALTADAVQVNLDTHTVDVTTAHGINNYAKKVQEAGIAPTLLNGWVNYGGLYSPAKYWKDTIGMVHLQGLIKSGTIGTVAFVLPAGYRPLYRMTFPTVSDGAFADVVVVPDGSVIMQAGSVTSFFLDGIAFRAEA